MTRRDYDSSNSVRCRRAAFSQLDRAADLVTLRYGQNAASAVELERIQSRAHAHG